MAEIIDNAELPSRHRYPWDEWTDGQTRRLTRGEDFETSARSLRTQIYAEAKRRGLRASAHLSGVVGDESVVTFRFYAPGPRA